MIHLLGWGLLHTTWAAAGLVALLALAYELGPDSPRWRYRLGVATLSSLLVLPFAFASWFGSPAAVHTAAPGAAGAPVSPLTYWLLLVSLGMRWVLEAWAVTVTVLLLRWVGGWILLRRWVRRAAPAPRPWEREVQSLALRLGVNRSVGVRVSRDVNVPTVIGGRRPMVLLPPDALTVFSREARTAILAHEVGHLARHDDLVDSLQRLVETVYCFHPAVHWLSRRVREDRERCCDDLVLQLQTDPVLYARTLTRLEEMRSCQAGRTAFRLAATGIGRGGLLDRVRRIVLVETGHRPTRPGLLTAGKAASALALLLLGAGKLVPETRLALSSQLMRIEAQDPAGPFRVTVVNGQLVGAELDGTPLDRTQWRQTANEVRLIDPQDGTDLQVTIRESGIHWTPRSPRPKP